MEILAGLHPKVIHFPIVCFILYTLFELAGLILNNKNLSNTAFILLIIGVFTSVAAVLTGNQAHELAEKLAGVNAISIPEELIEEHEEYATFTLWFFFFLLAGRTAAIVKKKFTKRIQILFVVLAFIGCYFVYLAGDYGGRLVYKHGVGTEILNNIK